MRISPPAAQVWRRAQGMVVGILSVTIAGCATGPRLFGDQLDEPFDCRHIAWLETADRPASIAEHRVRSETMKTLAAKGYALDPDSPDCLVSGVVYTGDRAASAASVGVGAGRFGRRSSGRVGVHVPVGGTTRTVGNLAINVIDVQLHGEIWRGTLEAAFRPPEPSAEEISSAVRRILDSFPDRS